MTANDGRISPADLSIPFGQPVDLLVGRSGTTYAVPATYVGDHSPGLDGAPRRLTDAERERVRQATQAFAAAIAGETSSERELRRVVDLLHEASRAVEGEPRYRLADGRIVLGAGVAARARME
ncbi:MAG: hypothetical protein EPO26_02475 [Chloroflexota bacterium]|nr:MAG: hypothetical protein EPO26_02475 [Chloroflexota bacterium]